MSEQSDAVYEARVVPGTLSFFDHSGDVEVRRGGRLVAVVAHRFCPEGRSFGDYQSFEIRWERGGHGGRDPGRDCPLAALRAALEALR